MRGVPVAVEISRVLGVTALLDACVLYSAPMRDFLMRLATANLYDPRWSRAIHEEWMRNLLANRVDLTHEKLERVQGFMDVAMPQALVTGYEHLTNNLALPDPDDRHVLAAAIQGGARVLMTVNLRDFPASALAPFGICALHPDAFASRLFSEATDQMLKVIQNHRADLRKPPRTAAEYIATLRQNQLMQIADLLQQYQDDI